MTDNVVKAGIEDVLSSVRRLVTEEGHRDPDMVPSAAKRRPGRLVLTDALRIGDTARVEGSPAHLNTGSGYSAEISAKPMLLRACDIVRAGDTGQTGIQKEVAGAPSDDLAGSLSAKIEALEEAIARTEDQWEPDGDSDDAYSGTPTRPLDWTTAQGFAAPAIKDQPEVVEDDGEEEVPAATFVRAPQPSEPQYAEIATFEAKETQVQTLDEDALRDLVADVVRQELQGVLGERITRNVRKMVRREIYRALAAHKLD